MNEFGAKIRDPYRKDEEEVKGWGVRRELGPPTAWAAMGCTLKPLTPITNRALHPMKTEHHRKQSEGGTNRQIDRERERDN